MIASFINENSIILAIALPLLFFVLRDIFMAYREKKNSKRYEQMIIDSEKRLYNLIKQANQNKINLMKDISNLHKNIDDSIADIDKNINDKEKNT